MTNVTKLTTANDDDLTPAGEAFLDSIQDGDYPRCSACPTPSPTPIPPILSPKPIYEQIIKLILIESLDECYLHFRSLARYLADLRERLNHRTTCHCDLCVTEECVRLTIRRADWQKIVADAVPQPVEAGCMCGVSRRTGEVEHGRGCSGREES